MSTDLQLEKIRIFTLIVLIVETSHFYTMCQVQTGTSMMVEKLNSITMVIWLVCLLCQIGWFILMLLSYTEQRRFVTDGDGL